MFILLRLFGESGALSGFTMSVKLDSTFRYFGVMSTSGPVDFRRQTL